MGASLIVRQWRNGRLPLPPLPLPFPPSTPPLTRSPQYAQKLAAAATKRPPQNAQKLAVTTVPNPIPNPPPPTATGTAPTPTNGDGAAATAAGTADAGDAATPKGPVETPEGTPPMVW